MKLQGVQNQTACKPRPQVVLLQELPLSRIGQRPALPRCRDGPHSVKMHVQRASVRLIRASAADSLGELSVVPTALTKLKLEGVQNHDLLQVWSLRRS